MNTVKLLEEAEEVWYGNKESDDFHAAFGDAKRMVILRGVSGAGKSRVASYLRKAAWPLEVTVASGDDHFTLLDGRYRFNGSELGVAHKRCYRKVLDAALQCNDLIVVDNTNVTMVEIAPYGRLGEALDYNVSVVTVCCEPMAAVQRNVHGVSEEKILSTLSRIRNERLSSWWETVEWVSKYG